MGRKEEDLLNWLWGGHPQPKTRWSQFCGRQQLKKQHNRRRVAHSGNGGKPSPAMHLRVLAAPCSALHSGEQTMHGRSILVSAVVAPSTETLGTEAMSAFKRWGLWRKICRCRIEFVQLILCQQKHDFQPPSDACSHFTTLHQCDRIVHDGPKCSVISTIKVEMKYNIYCLFCLLWA